MAASSTTTKSSMQSSPSTPATSMGPRQKSSASPKPSKSQNESKIPASMPELNAATKYANNRMTFLLANFVGCLAYITVKNGDQFSGIFSGAALDQADSQYVLKMSKRIPSTQPQVTNGTNDSPDTYIGYGDDHVMTFDSKDVVDLNVPNVNINSLQGKITNGSSFRTDTDISGNLALRERELKRWEPAADPTLDLTMNGSGRGTWDQFEANERLYGVKTDYDENFYTTTIDRSHPTYRQRAAEAERLAREIESTMTTNTHVAEERNRKNPGADDVDEEERFSGVKRDFPPPASSQQNKYMPPAMRPPTGQPTVPGAPVDPAIISSQLVHADSSSSRLSKGPNDAPASVVMKENADPSRALPAEASSSTNMSQQADKDNAEDLSDPQSQKQSPTKSNADSIRVQAAQPQGALNATANVEHEVADAFRTFAASEKLKMQEKTRERQRQTARKEREVRLNDLKKFSLNFKLNTAVPEDILGILAKDKAKQVEIVGKSQQDLELRKATLSQGPPQDALADASDARAATDSQPEMSAVPAGPAGERAGPRGQMNNQAAQTFLGRKSDRNVMPQGLPLISPRGPGHLGERLLAQQQQYRGGRGYPNSAQQMPQDPRMHQAPPHQQQQQQQVPPSQQQQQQQQQRQQPLTGPPAAINTDIATRRHSGAPTPNSALSRFNAQASEFKPNPTATTFLPGTEETSRSTSPSRNRAQATRNPVNRVSFFGDKKPGTLSKKSIADGFNPIARMRKETIDGEKTKDFAVNGGIPQAYRTPPTWDAGKGHGDKSYVDMFGNVPSSVTSVSSGNYAMAHQHQLPPHLQQGSHAPSQTQTPQQTYRVHSNGQPRDNYFDDHRMHPSSSQQSSVGPSPSFRQPMLAYPPQMGASMQPHFVQNMGQYPVGPNGQPMTPLRQFPPGAQYMTPQGGPMPAPMMASHSNNGQFLVPMQGQLPMYSPGAQHFPGQMSMPQTSGQGYPSPRPGAPMMAHQGSQGHGAPHYMTPGPNQQGAPGGYGKQQPNQMHIRGGVAMMQQGSYGSSPHMQHNFPAQQRGGGGPQFGSSGMNYGYQQLHPGQMMHFPQNQQHQHTGPMRRPSEQSDVK